MFTHKCVSVVTNQKKTIGLVFYDGHSQAFFQRQLWSNLWTESANACPNTCLLADLIPPITLFSQTGFSGLRCFFSASHPILPFIRCEPLITYLPQRPMKGSTSATPRCFWGEIYGTFCLKWDRLVLGKLMLQCLILRRNKITHCSILYTSIHLCFSGGIFNLPHFINLICKT